MGSMALLTLPRTTWSGALAAGNFKESITGGRGGALLDPLRQENLFHLLPIKLFFFCLLQRQSVAPNFKTNSWEKM